MLVTLGRWFGVGDIIIAGTVLHALAKKYPKTMLMVDCQNHDKESWIKMVYPNYHMLRDDSGREFGGVKPLKIIETKGPWCDLELPGVHAPNFTHTHEVWAALSGVKPERYTLEIPVEDLQWAMNYLNNPSYTVILSPFSRNIVNSWPNSYWLRLIDELLNSKVRILINDNEFIKETNFNMGCKGCGSNYQPNFEIFKDFEKLPNVEASKIAALISCSDLVVGIDSGLCHVAAMLDRPTIVLAAPTSGRKLYGWYQTAKVFEASAHCSPCYMPWLRPMSKQCSRGCPLMKVITPEMVFGEAIRSITGVSIKDEIRLDAEKMLENPVANG